MNRSLSLCSLVLLIALTAGCAGAERPTTDAVQAAGLETRVYEVFGMDCPGCHGGLEKLILRIPGVHAAKANWEQKKLTVTLKRGAELDDGDITEAIRKANFTPGERLQ